MRIEGVRSITDKFGITALGQNRMKLKSPPRFGLIGTRSHLYGFALTLLGSMAFAAAIAAPPAPPSAAVAVPFEDRLPDPVAAALVRAQLPAAHYSVYVREVGAALPAWTLNADAARNPASLMKLFTTAAALETMGPQFVWRTRLWSRAGIVDGVLMGDLWVEGGGDPGLVRNDLLDMLRDLRAQGIRRIAGGLRIDRRLFDALDADESGFDNDPRRAYNAAPDALLLGQKATAIKFMPSADGHAIAVRVDPIADETALETDVRPVEGVCGDWKGMLAVDPLPGGHLRIGGRYPVDCGVRTLYLNLTSADEYWARGFAQSWREAGGEWPAGGLAVASGAIPADARVLAESTSAPLALRVRDINKYSNNVMARELLISLGGYVSGKPGTPARGAEAVRDFLRSLGIDASELVIENGAGLSRAERVSPRHLGELLVAMFRGRTMPEYVASLPVLGLDGTLQRRLVGRSAAGYAHLKSGTLGRDADPASEVRGIAGYVLARSGRRYVVVAIANGPGARDASPVNDALVQWLCDNG